MTQNIEAVIFDLGRVLIHIDLEPMQKMLISSGASNDGEETAGKVRESGLIPQLNSGKISFEQFCFQISLLLDYSWSLRIYLEYKNYLFLKFLLEVQNFQSQLQ